MSRFTIIKISKFNIVTLIMASNIIVAIYMRELIGYFYLKRDLVLKYLTGLHTI